MTDPPDLLGTAVQLDGRQTQWLWEQLWAQLPGKGEEWTLDGRTAHSIMALMVEGALPAAAERVAEAPAPSIDVSIVGLHFGRIEVAYPPNRR